MDALNNMVQMELRTQAPFFKGRGETGLVHTVCTCTGNSMATGRVSIITNRGALQACTDILLYVHTDIILPLLEKRAWI